MVMLLPPNDSIPRPLHLMGNSERLLIRSALSVIGIGNMKIMNIYLTVKIVSEKFSSVTGMH